MPGQMLRHRLDSEREGPPAPVSRKLRVTNQAAAGDHQREARRAKPDPRHAIQAQEEIEHLEGQKDNHGHEQKSPMLKECLPPAVFVSILHDNLPSKPYLMTTGTWLARQL